jgi:hypothetical protein
LHDAIRHAESQDTSRTLPLFLATAQTLGKVKNNGIRTLVMLFTMNNEWNASFDRKP